MRTKKTKKEFLEEFSSCPELAKRTLKAGRLSWKELCEMRDDAYDPSSGSIPGMIYYKDTVPFAKRNHLLILKEFFKYMEDVGEVVRIPVDDEVSYYNYLAWFAWQIVMGEVLNYFEFDE